ncbi:MAG: hypothetical protein ACKVTZ_08920 [Bacteroidia bacterium]
MLYIWILLVVALSVGAYFYFHIHQIQIRNRAFAQKTGLSLTGSYIRPILNGSYRGYEIAIDTILEDKGKRARWVKIAVKMQNPNEKSLHIYHSQDVSIFPEEYLAEIGETQLKEHFRGTTQGKTNDLFFSSLLLTDEIKRQIGIEMPKHSDTLLFFQGEELAYLSPCIASFESSQTEWLTQLNLICNMKDALQ